MIVFKSSQSCTVTAFQSDPPLMLVNGPHSVTVDRHPTHRSCLAVSICLHGESRSDLLSQLCHSIYTGGVRCVNRLTQAIDALCQLIYTRLAAELL